MSDKLPDTKRRRRLTPKQRVLKKWPNATINRYPAGWFVDSPSYPLANAATARQAWALAAKEIPHG